MRPERAVRGQRGTLHIAVAITPDFGQRTGLADKRVVWRHRAIFVDAHDLAMMVIKLLRIFLARKALAQRQEQFSVGRRINTRRTAFNNPAAKVGGTGKFWFLAEDDLDLFQPRIVNTQRGARQRRPATGAPSLPLAATTRSRPGRSVTKNWPPGRNAKPQGFCKPAVTTSGRTSCAWAQGSTRLETTTVTAGSQCLPKVENLTSYPP